MQKSVQRLGGSLAVFASAFCFYLSTVVIRWSRTEVSIDPSYFAFARFLLGFLVVCAIMGYRRQGLKPRSYHLLIGRTLANCVAVYCFYMAVKHTSVAEANLLNMTYPVFVALITWAVFRQQRDVVAMAMVGIAFAGIWLILAPGGMTFRTNSLWGLASGMSASVAIIYLNVSRQYHDVNTVLFFMFGLGGSSCLPGSMHIFSGRINASSITWHCVRPPASQGSFCSPWAFDMSRRWRAALFLPRASFWPPCSALHWPAILLSDSLVGWAPCCSSAPMPCWHGVKLRPDRSRILHEIFSVLGSDDL